MLDFKLKRNYLSLWHCGYGKNKKNIYNNSKNNQYWHLISASDLIPDKFCVISMEFLSLSRRRSSSRNVLHRRWSRRNVCRSQASVRGTRTQPPICVSCSVHYWVSLQLIREVFSRLHLCRHTFASLWGDCLRLVSLWRANSCRDSYVLGCSSFKHMLRSAICLRKTYVFQEFAEGLLSIFVCWIFQSVQHP